MKTENTKYSLILK